MRVEVVGDVAALVEGEVVDDGPAVGWQVRDASLVTSANETETLQLGEVAADGALMFAGVVREPSLRGPRFEAVIVV